MAGGVGRPSAALVPGEAERSFPERRARRRRVSRSLSGRCRMILRCADGVPNKVAAAELGIDRRTVGKWRRRLVRDRLEGPSDGPRSGRPWTVGDDRVAYVLERTLHTTPPDAIRWSTRPMARESGLSRITVRHIRNTFGQLPHRSQTFRPSGDPVFADKVRDIVGLHLSPPDRTVVLRVDGKSRIRVPGRTQPVPPLRPGISERRTRDCRRNGTTPPFTALDIAVGFVIGKCRRRGRSKEFPDFPKGIDARVPKGPDVHTVMDNHATRRTAAVGAWPVRRPYWHVHFTPTSASRITTRSSVGSPS